MSSSRGRAALSTWIWPVLALGFGAFAYHPLLALHAPSGSAVEQWLFRPSHLPVGLVLAVAGWLVWRRRERLSGKSSPQTWPASAALTSGGKPPAASHECASVFAEKPVRQCRSGWARSRFQSSGP